MNSDLQAFWKSTNANFILTPQEITKLKLEFRSAMICNRTSLELYNPNKKEGLIKWAESENLKVKSENREPRYQKDSPIEVAPGGLYITLDWSHLPRS